MKITRNKAVTLVTIILLSLMVTSIFAVNVSAHSPAINIRTWTEVAVAPNPVGVNQDTLLLFWLTQAPPGGADDATARWKFNVTVTNPSNVTTSLGTFLSDSTGKASTTFRPDVTGTWTVTVNFPETKYTWNSNVDELVYTNDTFLASTTSRTFTVQTEAVKSGIPPEYQQSTDWFKLIGSGCLGTNIGASVGGTTGRCEADAPVLGPSTAHILWTRPLEPGGIVGGSNVGVPGQQFFTGSSYWMRYQVTGLMNGYFYYREAAASSGQTGNIWVVNIRDGSIMGQTSTTTVNPGYSCNGVNVLMTTGTTMTAYDPKTLALTGWSLSNVPSGTLAIGEHGERLVFSFSSNGANITQWNSSRVITQTMPAGATVANLPQYYDVNAPTKYWDKTAREWVPYTIPSTYRNIINAAPGGYLICGQSSNNGYNNNSMNWWSINMKPGHEGEIVSNYTFYQRGNPNDPTNAVNTMPGHYVTARMVDPVNNVVCVAYRELCAWRGMNLNDGQVYDPEPQAKFDFFGYLPNTALSSLEHDMDGFVAYGHLYTAQYGGILYCYNTSNMELLWTYGSQPLTDKLDIPNSTALGVGGVYARAPTFIGGIADGKVYTFAAEHSVNTPIYKGSKIRCVDAFTGAEIFTIDAHIGCFTGIPSFTPPAYGHLIYLNLYDQQIYDIAKGPSETTVSTAPQVAKGVPVIIKGTIMDISAGTNQTGIVSRFPLGVPAICDDNMSKWMECVYLQRPRPENIFGVNVTLSVIGPDGLVQDIGTTTSDSTGYYNFLWTPPTTGTYNVLASFTGTNSYTPSYAQSELSVTGPAPQTVTPSPVPPPETDSYILDFTAAIIAVIILAGVAIILTLRRRA